MRNYLSSVVDPFGATQPSFIPDGVSLASISLRDYTTAQLQNMTGSDAYGCLITLNYGRTIGKSTYGSTTNPLLYEVAVLFTTADDEPLLNGSSKYESSAPEYYAQITGGSAAGGGWDRDTALATSFRPISLGLRALSTVETVTDTSSQRCLYFIGGQLSSDEIVDAIADTTSIPTLMRATPCSHIYANSEGCTARFDPFQSDNILQFRNASTLTASGSPIDFSAVRFPAVFVRFANVVAHLDQAPVLLETIFWLEALLKLPSPIYSEPSPVDPAFDTIVSAYRGCPDTFPLVVKGHTFPSFDSRARRFASRLWNVVRVGSHINPQLRQAVSAVDELVGASARIGRRRRLRRKRRKRRKRGTRGGGLPGRRAPKLRRRRQVRNTN
jgi:hypothetical protein